MGKEKLTTVQLQQKIIHLQAEISKYQNRLKDYEENYHYQLLEELKITNRTLREKNRLLEESFQGVYEEKNELIAKIKDMEKNLLAVERDRDRLAQEFKEKHEQVKQMKTELESYKTAKDGRNGLPSNGEEVGDGTDWFTRNLLNQSTGKNGKRE